MSALPTLFRNTGALLCDISLKCHVLSFQGLSNGVENDQNTANIPPGDISHKRLSTGSTMSNQSFDSGNVEYALPKHQYVQHRSESEINDKTYTQPKISNPLFGVNAASHYAPQPVLKEEDLKHYDIPSLPNGVRKAPEGQDNDVLKNEDAIDGRKDLVVSPNQIALTEGGSATYTTDNNGKINVHVTVMINAGNYMHPYEHLQLTRNKHSTYLYIAPVFNNLYKTFI